MTRSVLATCLAAPALGTAILAGPHASLAAGVVEALALAMSALLLGVACGLVLASRDTGDDGAEARARRAAGDAARAAPVPPCPPAAPCAPDGQANFDPVTGLPTRRRLVEHAAALRRRGETAAHPLALLHLDIDGFRAFNDSFGREVADRFLCHVAETLRRACGADDLAVRSGADDFMVLLVGHADPDEILELAQSLQMRVSTRTAIDGHKISVTASVGVATDAADMPVGELMTRAANALAEATRLGRGRVSLYTSDLGDRLRRRRETVIDLWDAIERDEIEPFFQPQVDAATGAVAGFEALVRWRHPLRGTLAPWQFLKIGAEAGLTDRIGALMRQKSFCQLAAWRAAGFDVPRIALNVTAAEMRGRDFVDMLIFDIDRAGLAPSDVAVELLESAMIEEHDDPAASILARLSEAGFRVELDDFGTGHASISNLHRIHVDGIKIDRSFVTKLDERPEQQKLTGAMLSLAAALGIESIAEGVETEAERRMLVAMGCRRLQGYAIAKPMAGTEATRWLAARLTIRERRAASRQA